MVYIREIRVKTVITKSKIPGIDFVINPYVGCFHGCKYCYAEFMKKFTNHPEEWGSFIDIKINSPDIITKDLKKYKNELILIGSVTDPYQPIEAKYQITKKILERLLPVQPHLQIMTKSALVLRDLDLIKQFKNCIVIISLSQIDDDIRKQLEPEASTVEERVKTLKILHDAGISTILFISPIIPELTNWMKIIQATESSVDQYWFENLNLYSYLKPRIYNFLNKNYPPLIEKYQKIYYTPNNYWWQEEQKITLFCQKENLDCRVYFHYRK